MLRPGDWLVMDYPSGSPSADRARLVSRFAYEPPTLLMGAGATEELGAELIESGIDSVLVVCNRSIGELDPVIDPVCAGLGERCAGVFSEVTGDKRLTTAWAAAQTADKLGAEGILGLGAGSALDVATVTAALVDHDCSFESVHETLLATGRVPFKRPPRPLVTIPTTLAGAELSQGAGINAKRTEDSFFPGGISDPSLCPVITVYDAELVAHTPTQILRGSTMNGFNKGIEALYSPSATPVTDATAMRGLSILMTWLPTLTKTEPSIAELDAILEGNMLVQFGGSRPGTTSLSVIHAFGHGLRDNAGVQQGIAHAIITPHVLRSLFEQAPCRRATIAKALGVTEDSVVDAVKTLRDELGLPTRLRSIEGLEQHMLLDIAEDTLADGLMANCPVGVDLELDDMLEILERAW